MKSLIFLLALLAGCSSAVVDTPPARPSVPLGDTTDFVGRYLIDADDVLTFRRDGDRFTVARTAQAPAALEALSATEFIDRATGETYAFGEDSVSVGGKTLQRTRAASPFELLAREPKLGLMQYDLLDPALRTEERLRARGEFLRAQGNLAAARAILQYNVKRHPESAAAQDALRRLQEP